MEKERQNPEFSQVEQMAIEVKARQLMAGDQDLDEDTARMKAQDMCRSGALRAEIEAAKEAHGQL